MLTTKQEQFVQGIINGMSQREAYKNAYDAERMSDNAIDREASLLMSNPKVAQRFTELRDALVEPTILSAKQRLEYLTRVITGEEEETAYTFHDGESFEYTRKPEINTRLKAVDLMNKMTGEYVQKIQADVNQDVVVVIDLVE